MAEGRGSENGMDRVVVGEGMGSVDVKQVGREEMFALRGDQDMVQEGLVVWVGRRRVAGE